jgi:iron complex outermembrane receptor protein
LIGQVPPGTPPHLIRANVQYDIPGWEGFSIDGQVEVTGSHYANRRNTLRVPSAAKLALGARYTFTALGAKATLRTQVLNLTNAYDWTVNGASGRLSPTSPRTFSVKLAADF